MVARISLYTIDPRPDPPVHNKGFIYKPKMWEIIDFIPATAHEYFLLQHSICHFGLQHELDLESTLQLCACREHILLRRVVIPQYPPQQSPSLQSAGFSNVCSSLVLRHRGFGNSRVLAPSLLPVLAHGLNMFSCGIVHTIADRARRKDSLLPLP